MQQAAGNGGLERDRAVNGRPESALIMNTDHSSCVTMESYLASLNLFPLGRWDNVGTYLM